MADEHLSLRCRVCGAHFGLLKHWDGQTKPRVADIDSEALSEFLAQHYRCAPDNFGSPQEKPAL